MNKTKQSRNVRSIYCIAVIQLKKLYGGSDVRVDQYAELICIDDNVATVVSRKYGISKDDIDFVSISFATNSNAHLGFCGHATDVLIDDRAAVYTVEIPKAKQLHLKNGDIIEVPNENLIKYNNIYKAKRTGPSKDSLNVNEKSKEIMDTQFHEKCKFA